MFTLSKTLPYGRSGCEFMGGDLRASGGPAQPGLLSP